jgi:ribosomal protein L40E
VGIRTYVGDGQPFQRYQCLQCGAHNPPRDRPYCSVCGSRELTPLAGPPLAGRPSGDGVSPPRQPKEDTPRG